MTDPSADEPLTPEQIESGLGALLGDHGLAGAQVTIVGAASVGAVRSTLLIDITTADGVVAAVAQITASPYAEERRSMTIEDEANVIRLAGEAGAPVAEVLAAVVQAPGLNRSVLVSRRVDGESIPRRVLRLLDSKPGAGEALANTCGTVMAKLHSVDVDRVPANLERFDPANPARAYVAALRESLDERNDPHPVLRYALNWLDANLPSAPDAPALVHADFRNGNVIISPDGSLGAVVDWEVAHVGDPMEDLAYLCLRTWRFGNHDREVGGFGSVLALRQGYEAAGGTWRQDAFDWWMIARNVWWGIGLAGQAGAFSEGLSTSIVHAASGRRVVELEYDVLMGIAAMTSTAGDHL